MHGKVAQSDDTVPVNVAAEMLIIFRTLAFDAPYLFGSVTFDTD